MEDPGDALGDDADLVVVRKRGRGNESEGRRKIVKKTLSQKEAKKTQQLSKLTEAPLLSRFESVLESQGTQLHQV